MVALSRNSDMDCGLVCLEFRGVFARVLALVGFPTVGRLARGPALRGLHLRAAHAHTLRACGPLGWAAREVVFLFPAN